MFASSRAALLEAPGANDAGSDLQNFCLKKKQILEVKGASLLCNSRLRHSLTFMIISPATALYTI